MRSYRRKKITTGIDSDRQNVSCNTDAGSRPGTDVGSRPGTNAGSQPGTDVSSQTGTNAGSQPGTDAGNQPDTGSQPGTGGNKVFNTVAGNLCYLKNKLGAATDLVENTYRISGGKLTAGFAYISVLADKDLISRNVLTPLMEMDTEPDNNSAGIMAALQSKIPATDTYVTEIKNAI